MRSKMTAYQCPRIDPIELENERKSMPDHEFRREYLCEFDDLADLSIFGTREQIEAAFTDEVKPLWDEHGNVIVDPLNDDDVALKEDDDPYGLWAEVRKGVFG